MAPPWRTKMALFRSPRGAPHPESRIRKGGRFDTVRPSSSQVSPVSDLQAINHDSPRPFFSGGATRSQVTFFLPFFFLFRLLLEPCCCTMMTLLPAERSNRSRSIVSCFPSYEQETNDMARCWPTTCLPSMTTDTGESETILGGSGSTRDRITTASKPLFLLLTDGTLQQHVWC
jgi:hypothetical protein